ncbi:MAG: UvrD-helicase domain-containing protein [Blautia sp.]
MALSESQKRAVSRVKGPLLCLAGPGSGKTTVITARTRFLIEEKKISPMAILVITFTKAAALEMKERFQGPDGRTFLSGDLRDFSFCFFLDPPSGIRAQRSQYHTGRAEISVLAGASFPTSPGDRR